MTGTIGHGESITESGYQQLQQELEHLSTVQRDELAEVLREVRGDGDVNENPAVLEVLEQQAHLEHRIAELRSFLASATITSAPDDGTAGVGSFVRMRDEDGELLEYELVSEMECDADQGKVSIEAPIGEAVLGLRAGDTATVTTPRGSFQLEVLAVERAAARTKRAS